MTTFNGKLTVEGIERVFAWGFSLKKVEYISIVIESSALMQPVFMLNGVERNFLLSRPKFLLRTDYASAKESCARIKEV